MQLVLKNMNAKNPDGTRVLNLKGKAAVFLIGLSGVGKTAMLLWLLKRRVEACEGPKSRGGYKKQQWRLVCHDPPPGFEIGDERSKTVLLRSAPLGELEGVDTPGAGETDGVNLDVANCMCITHAFKECGSATLAWVISAEHLKSRAMLFRKNLGLMARLMPTAFNDGMYRCILPLFTHADSFSDIQYELFSILSDK
jgi:hypothetical protein